MKTTPLRLIGCVAAYLLVTLAGQADAASYAQILKERDGVLSQLLTELESRRATGLGDDDAIAAAQLALYHFRREVAPTSEQKIKQQELIVGVHERKLKNARVRMSNGLSSNFQVLEVTATLLEAKQVLEELRLGHRNGGPDHQQ